ncbi:MAG: response regulator transcription factor [Sulfurospirillaceae bacterium]|nr:response regulator transcription factor [Sulfurospirillaceae bacterium]
MKPNKIFLLEDDVNLNETIAEFLEEEGYIVTSAYDGDEARDLMYENSFDIYLLDVNVPGINGFEVLKKAREANDKIPAIFITSLNTLEDVEKGYISGCDDYIRKPFELKELLFRIQTLLNRGFFHSNDSKIEIDNEILYDTLTNELIVSGNVVRMQNKEAALLKLFLQKQDQIITHEVIYDTLWSYDEVSSDDALRTYIKNLRKIIGKDKIVSVKKLGYKFTTK